MTDHDEVSTITPSAGVSRRGFLAGGGALAAGAVVFAACGKDDKKSTTGSKTTDATEAPSGGGDAKIAATAAALEVLAVATYKGGLDAATAGKLGAVPPAVATYAKTAMAAHQSSLNGWNAVLKSLGQPAVTAPPADLKATVDTQFAAVKDVTGLAKLALGLEQIAADTYLAVLPSISDKAAITMAGAQQTLGQERAAILLFVLGQYPVPDVFQSTKNAYKG